MPETTIPARITPEHRALAATRFYALAEVPPELEWFTNIRNERTRAAYRLDIRDFMDCIGIEHPEDFRLVTRAHVIAWRDSFKARELSPATIRRKLSALSSLYQSLCEKNAVPLNPDKGIQRPKANNNEGTTPALSDEQARALLKAPPENTLQRHPRPHDSFRPSLSRHPAGGALHAHGPRLPAAGMRDAFLD